MHGNRSRNPAPARVDTRILAANTRITPARDAIPSSHHTENNRRPTRTYHPGQAHPRVDTRLAEQLLGQELVLELGLARRRLLVGGRLARVGVVGHRYPRSAAAARESPTSTWPGLEWSRSGFSASGSLASS